MALTASHIMLIKILTDTAITAMTTIRLVDGMSEEEVLKRTKAEEDITARLDRILEGH